MQQSFLTYTSSNYWLLWCKWNEFLCCFSIPQLILKIQHNFELQQSKNQVTPVLKNFSIAPSSPILLKANNIHELAKDKCLQQQASRIKILECELRPLTQVLNHYHLSLKLISTFAPKGNINRKERKRKRNLGFGKVREKKMKRLKFLCESLPFFRIFSF